MRSGTSRICAVDGPHYAELWEYQGSVYLVWPEGDAAECRRLGTRD
jgi:hypothetical protein